jgi:hypothetical protein
MTGENMMVDNYSRFLVHSMTRGMCLSSKFHVGERQRSGWLMVGGGWLSW